MGTVGKNLPLDWKGDSVWHGETEIADYSCVNTKYNDKHLCFNIVDEISHGQANLETRWHTQDVPQDPVLPFDKITININVFSMLKSVTTYMYIDFIRYFFHNYF